MRVYECVNENCRSGLNKESLVTANHFSLAFFAVEGNRKKKICIECQEVAMTNRKELAEKLVDGRRFQENIEYDIILVVDSDEEVNMDSNTSEDDVESFLLIWRAKMKVFHLKQSWKEL